MKRLVAILLALQINTATSQETESCKRLPFDEEVPAGLTGDYEIIGKDPFTGKTYAGVLRLGVGKDVYTLTRIVEGKIMKGEAWIEACSPDKFHVLVAKYQFRTSVTKLGCYLRGDGDNYFRASCTSFNGKGLEAWYQSHGPLLP